MKLQNLFAVFILNFYVFGWRPSDAHGQGFQNLNFESAVIVPIPGDPHGQIQFGPAFPAWSCSLYPVAGPAMFNNAFLDRASVSLLNSATVVGRSISNNTALIQALGGINGPNVSLFQTGAIPAETVSLRFHGFNFGLNPVVSLNGQPLNFGVLQDFGNFQEYGADISAFAGQTAELRFTKLRNTSDFYFDNIVFSTVAVPEPTTWALLGLGSALLWCAARRRRK